VKGWISPAFVKSLPVPGVEPTAPGAVCIQVHPDWIPYIAGALDVFRQAAVWAGTESEIDTATRQAGNLLDLVASATTCPTGGEETNLDYILIRDEKPLNTNGGSAIAGLQTRVLTTIVTDTGSHASLSSNQITLAAGTYEMQITCPAYQVLRHRARLYNVSFGVTLGWGTSEYTSSSDGVMSSSLVIGRFTLPAAAVLEVQHYCQQARGSGLGLGVASNLGTDEVYTVAEFRRVGE